jgi:hypothetical protein
MNILPCTPQRVVAYIFNPAACRETIRGGGGGGLAGGSAAATAAGQIIPDTGSEVGGGGQVITFRYHHMHGDNGMSSSVFLLDHSPRMECSG